MPHLAGNPNPVLCDNLEAWHGEGSEGGFKRKGAYIYIAMDDCYIDIWHRLS